ncbi:hypothetical protein COV24_02140 [candidate division WWE3 bacterium CG10_big_fil_rev_8_21_14_0_10_32_10]|uniref:N-acetyltransferase domain-containing protein n=1 Tax=candidate division WWE3 bacterium CG10_big_fil_rev_8_21_14_0_10_32_10 TaxID=1975090 RepID=A0A2H0RAP3_UNCKA|nr:MAG: hypothetical protein COV24_02140 [candidate division WWE3 bacterium CG10_big_fil_rev_8_21_14_0_10_32_10]
MVENIEKIENIISAYPYPPELYFTKLGVSADEIIAGWSSEIINRVKNGTPIIFQENLGLVCYKESSFDTKVLKLNTARIYAIIPSDIDNMESLRALVEFVTDSLFSVGVEYATYRFNSKDVNLQDVLLARGFTKVDDYVVLVRNAETPISEYTRPQGISIRIAQELDVPILQKNHSHTFTSSRFFVDPAVTTEAATLMHSEWINNSVKKQVADEVMVAVDETDTPIGFITLSVESKYNITTGHIPLIGVRRDPEFVGKKIGRLLMEAAFKWFNDRECTYFFIETQGANYAAIKSYEGAGYTPIGQGITYSWSNN